MASSSTAAHQAMMRIPEHMQAVPSPALHLRDRGAPLVSDASTAAPWQLKESYGKEVEVTLPRHAQLPPPSMSGAPGAVTTSQFPHTATIQTAADVARKVEKEAEAAGSCSPIRQTAQDLRQELRRIEDLRHALLRSRELASTVASNSDGIPTSAETDLVSDSEDASHYRMNREAVHTVQASLRRVAQRFERADFGSAVAAQPNNLESFKSSSDVWAIGMVLLEWQKNLETREAAFKNLVGEAASCLRQQADFLGDVVSTNTSPALSPARRSSAQAFGFAQHPLPDEAVHRTAALKQANDGRSSGGTVSLPIASKPGDHLEQDQHSRVLSGEGAYEESDLDVTVVAADDVQGNVLIRSVETPPSEMTEPSAEQVDQSHPASGPGGHDALSNIASAVEAAIKQIGAGWHADGHKGSAVAIPIDKDPMASGNLSPTLCQRQRNIRPDSGLGSLLPSNGQSSARGQSSTSCAEEAEPQSFKQHSRARSQGCVGPSTAATGLSGTDGSSKDAQRPQSAGPTQLSARSDTSSDVNKQQAKAKGKPRRSLATVFRKASRSQEGSKSPLMQGSRSPSGAGTRTPLGPGSRTPLGPGNRTPNGQSSRSPLGARGDADFTVPQMDVETLMKATWEGSCRAVYDSPEPGSRPDITGLRPISPKSWSTTLSPTRGFMSPAANSRCSTARSPTVSRKSSVAAPGGVLDTLCERLEAAVTAASSAAAAAAAGPLGCSTPGTPATCAVALHSPVGSCRGPRIPVIAPPSMADSQPSALQHLDATIPQGAKAPTPGPLITPTHGNHLSSEETLSGGSSLNAIPQSPKQGAFASTVAAMRYQHSPAMQASMESVQRASRMHSATSLK